VKNWHVVRRPPEAPDFFALGTLGGEAELKGVEGPVRVRFSTMNGRPFLRVEEHLVYKVRRQGPTEVTFAWTEGGRGVEDGEPHGRAVRVGGLLLDRQDRPEGPNGLG